LGAAPALHDLEPLRERLPEVIDFDRLNGGETRLSVAATDVVSGERVVFDTARGGARIGPEHLAASSALLPLFAPVEVEGRLLGDGGLAANTPVDLVLDEPDAGDLLCFVVELFALQGSPPRTLAASVSRATDLAFGGQTRRILEGREREHRLRALVGRLAERLPPELRDDPEVASILAEAEAARGARPCCASATAPRPDEAAPGGAFDFLARHLGRPLGGRRPRHARSAAPVRDLARDRAPARAWWCTRWTPDAGRAARRPPPLSALTASSARPFSCRPRPGSPTSRSATAPVTKA
jgi:NTE family protein